MAINNEKFGFTVRNETTGLPLSGALVELRKGATIYALTEVDTSGYYVIDVIPTGKYSVYIDAADSGQTMGVGTGQIAALGNEADNTPLSTASEFEFKTPEALKTTLELDQVNNVAIPIPTPSDENKVPIVDSNGDYVLGSPNASGLVQTFEVNTASDWQAALSAEFDEKYIIINRDTLRFASSMTFEVYGRNTVVTSCEPDNFIFSNAVATQIVFNEAVGSPNTKLSFTNSVLAFNPSGDQVDYVFNLQLFCRGVYFDPSALVSGTGNLIYEKDNGAGVPVGVTIFTSQTYWDDTSATYIAGQNILFNQVGQDIEISSTGTSAGISTRVYLTGDVETVNSVDYYGLSTTQGAVASVEQQVLVGDNQKLFFGQDFISDSYAFDTSIKSGAYTSILTVEADSSAAEKRYTMETYVTDINGTPINAGGPVGDLGVETIGILDSGIISLDTNDVTQIELINQLEFDVPVVTGQRIRLHLSAEKVGAAGGNVTLSLFSGSDYVSYFDVPANIFSTDVTDLSTVNPGGTQAQTNEILDAKIDAIDLQDVTDQGFITNQPIVSNNVIGMSAPVFNNVPLSALGGGTLFLADDGTYKAAGGGSQDLDSVLTVGNTSTLGATFGDNVNINNNGILFVDGTTSHRGVDWKTNGILNWAWLMSSTDNIKLNKYNTSTGLYVSTPLEFEHGTDNALFNGGATFGNIPVGTQVGLVGYDATGKLIQGTGGGGASDWSHDFEYTPATSASVQMKTHSSFTVGGIQYIPNDGATYTITGFTLSNGLTSTVQTSDVNIRAYSFNATGGQRGVGTGTLLYDWTAISTTGAQAVEYYTRSNHVTGLNITITNGQHLALDLIPNFYSLENTSVTVHIERS